MRWARGASPLLALRESPDPEDAILPLRPSQSPDAELAGNSRSWPLQGTLGVVVRVAFYLQSEALGLRGRAGSAASGRAFWLAEGSAAVGAGNGCGGNWGFPQTRGEDQHTEGVTNPECDRRL